MLNPSSETLRKGPKWDVLLNFAPWRPLVANFDMEPLNIMGDWYESAKRGDSGPPVLWNYEFLQKKHRCFKLTTTLTYLTIWIKKLKNKRCKYRSNNYLYLDHVQVFITLCVFPWLILKPHTCPILSPKVYILNFKHLWDIKSRNNDKWQKSCQCQPVHCLWKGPYFKALAKFWSKF